MQSQKQNTNYLVLKSKHWYYLNKQEKSIESQFLHSFYSDKCTLYSELILSSKWNLKLQKCSRIPTCLTLGPPAPPRRLARPEALPPPREPPNSWQEEIKWNPNSSMSSSCYLKGVKALGIRFSISVMIVSYTGWFWFGQYICSTSNLAQAL